MINLYGTRKYGVGAPKYGPSTSIPVNLLYGLWVDWDGSGTLPDASGNEAFGRLLSWRSRRGRQEFLRDSDQGGFAPYQIGELVIRLSNIDGRYDPLNAGSPIYPNCRSGKLAYWFVRSVASNTIYPIFAGRISGIRTTGYGANKVATITIEDGWRDLHEAEINIPIQQGVESEDALAQILNAANWPSFWGRDIGAGTETIPYYWEDGTKADQAVKNIADSEYGKFVLARTGQARFRSRLAISPNTFNFNQQQLLKDLEQRDQFKSIRDRVEITVQPRIPQSSGEVWRLRDVPFVANNDTIEIWSQFSFDSQPVPIINPITPQATTDYTANSQSDGSGSDLTSGLSISVYWFGERARIRIKNNSGSGAWITLLRVRGQALTVPNVNYAVAGDGTRAFKLLLPWQQTTSLANGLAPYILDILLDLPQNVFARMESRPNLQFAFDIGDEIGLVLPALGIDSTQQVGYIEHESIDEKSQNVRTSIYTEPLTRITGDFLTLDDEALGTLDENRLAL